ncbi:hypothetical protein BCR44DRAFT_346504 [Catenaria anguillulae PL171]|uniref:Uncharacterized protein n=1 Tax=Catenaria anguillulae PL171 TaxID=765915 RepID=A0A1Y2HBG0_9FUNG|nr:hypothetical protein BCR44DRAFT_346504 [Catenaria anguillulae PL171]
MVKRGVAVIVCTVIRRDTDAEYLLNLMVVATILYLYTLEHWNTRPLRSRFENNFRFVSYISAFALCMASTLKLQESHPEHSFINRTRLVFLGIFLAIPCVLAPWYGLFVILNLRKQALVGLHARNQRRTSSLLASRLRLDEMGDEHALKLMSWYRVIGSATDFDTSADILQKPSQAALVPSSVSSERSPMTPSASGSMARKSDSLVADGKRTMTRPIRSILQSVNDVEDMSVASAPHTQVGKQ